MNEIMNKMSLRHPHISSDAGQPLGASCRRETAVSVTVGSSALWLPIPSLAIVFTSPALVHIVLSHSFLAVLDLESVSVTTCLIFNIQLKSTGLAPLGCVVSGPNSLFVSGVSVLCS